MPAASPGINLWLCSVILLVRLFVVGMISAQPPEGRRAALRCHYPYRFILGLKVLVNAASKAPKSFPGACCRLAE